jgi:integrase
LLPHIRRENPAFPDFGFHDLRATFGMNLLETLLGYIDEKNEKERSKGGKDFIGSMWALEQVQERMGHADMKTTMQYLNYRRNKQWRAKIINEYEGLLLKHAHAPDNALQM